MAVPIVTASARMAHLRLQRRYVGLAQHKANRRTALEKYAEIHRQNFGVDPSLRTLINVNRSLLDTDILNMWQALRKAEVRQADIVRAAMRHGIRIGGTAFAARTIAVEAGAAAEASVDRSGDIITDEVRLALRRGAEILRQEMRAILSLPGDSLPGQSPAMDSGALRDSIRVDEQALADPYNPTISVGPTVEYAEMLEEGTRTMLPRPFMEKAAQRAARRIREEIELAFTKAQGRIWVRKK